MKKTWNTPEVEALNIAATATDFWEEGSDHVLFDDPITGEGCSKSEHFGSQCS